MVSSQKWQICLLVGYEFRLLPGTNSDLYLAVLPLTLGQFISFSVSANIPTTGEPDCGVIYNCLRCWCHSGSINDDGNNVRLLDYDDVPIVVAPFTEPRMGEELTKYMHQLPDRIRSDGNIPDD